MRSLMNTRWKPNSCFINIQPGVLKLTAELLREHVVKLRWLCIAGLQRTWITTCPAAGALFALVAFAAEHHAGGGACGEGGREGGVGGGWAEAGDAVLFAQVVVEEGGDVEHLLAAAGGHSAAAVGGAFVQAGGQVAVLALEPALRRQEGVLVGARVGRVRRRVDATAEALQDRQIRVVLLLQGGDLVDLALGGADTGVAVGVAVEFDVGDGVAGAEGVAAAGERVGGQAGVVEGAVVHVAGQELVEARVVGAEAHVVLGGGGVPAHRVVPVGVERLGGGRAGGGVLVGAGELGLVVVAVGGVGVGGGGAAGLAGDGFDVGVVVVGVVAAGRRPIRVVGGLGQPGAAGGVVVGLGDGPERGLGDQVGRQPEVGVLGGGAAGGLGGLPVQRVVGVSGGVGAAAAVLLLVGGDVVEPVVGVLLQDLPAAGDGVQAAGRVVVVIRGGAAGGGGEQPVPVVVVGSVRPVNGLRGDVVAGVVGVGLGGGAVLGDGRDPVPGVVGVGQVGGVVVGVHHLRSVGGLAAVGVVGVGVRGDQGAAGGVLGLGLRHPVGEVGAIDGVAVGFHLVRQQALRVESECRHLRGGVGGGGGVGFGGEQVPRVVGVG